MTEIIDWVISPIGQGVIWGVVGILAKTFAPAWVPLLGGSQKLMTELISLLKTTPEPNSEIVKRAACNELKAAEKVLKKQLGPIERG